MNKMPAKWERPLNVDLTCNLRIMGQPKPTIQVSTDEGDGYEFFPGDNLELVRKWHYEEWAEQLENVVAWLREKAEGMPEE